MHIATTSQPIILHTARQVNQSYCILKWQVNQSKGLLHNKVKSTSSKCDTLQPNDCQTETTTEDLRLASLELIGRHMHLISVQSLNLLQILQWLVVYSLFTINWFTLLSEKNTHSFTCTLWNMPPIPTYRWWDNQIWQDLLLKKNLDRYLYLYNYSLDDILKPCSLWIKNKSQFAQHSVKTLLSSKSFNKKE